MGKVGIVEVITGPMFAGKTEELLRRVRRLEYAHKNIVLFKPQIDDRYEKSYIVSHNKTKALSIFLKYAREMFDYVDDKTDCVVIDEFQFLEREAIDIVLALRNRGMKIIISGLDLDFRGEPFGIMPEILAYADNVTKLTAICVCCNEPATRTQRIINGKPANYNDRIVLVGALESYEARCASCHEVIGKKYKYE